MAELTHLNEASVVHNLHSRYQSDLIYVSFSIEIRALQGVAWSDELTVLHIRHTPVFSL